MKKFCVIGSPVEHSRSPQLHEAGFREMNIAATFERVHVPPTELESWVKQEFKNYDGAAVTLPHKESIRPLLNAETEASQVIGAVNTLFHQEGNIIGTNTDCIGAMKALQTQVPSLLGKKVLLLGAGGAARAVVYGLVKGGAQVTIWNRTAEKAELLAHDFKSGWIQELEMADPEDFDVILNTTSVGLRKWESLLPEEFWMDQHVAFDVVYDPLETKFLSDAADAGAATVTGDQMLVYQALEQFRLWHGVELEPEVMATAFFLEE